MGPDAQAGCGGLGVAGAEGALPPRLKGKRQQVASGIGPFAIGSDGGGSIRIPASISGLYGLKASMGRVHSIPALRTNAIPGSPVGSR
jgi:hypothetical protein